MKAAGCLVAIALTLPAVCARAQDVRTAEQQYKNIQVLKGVPAAQINPTMHLIAGQLGVECQFCHIWEMWDREDKPMKQMARRMMATTADINKTMFGGAQVVTCYTCHRGQPKPVNTIVLPVPKPPSVDNPPPAPVLPTAAEIFARYVDALGGEDALRKVNSRVITGKRDIPSGPGGMIPLMTSVTIHQKAPNLSVATYKTDRVVFAEGFDGTAAWTRTIAGTVVTMPAPERGRFERSASLYEPLELTKNYSRVSVRGIETVGGREAYVVSAFADGDQPEQLYFDTHTGLLLRRAWSATTLAGRSPFQIDFDDYREVKGVRMPFVLRMNPAGPRTELGTSSTLRIDKVRVGVSIDNASFARPLMATSPQAASR